MKKKWKCTLSGRNKCRPALFRYAPVLLLLCGILSLYSCKDDGESIGKYDPNAPVSVNAVIPETGGIQTPVVIEGSNFGTDKSKVEVYFNTHKALVINVKNDCIYALVPKSQGGDNEVRVVVDGTNQAVLKDKKFNYVVSSKVTTVGSNYFTGFKDLVALSADNEDNLMVCQEKEVKLYSIKDDAMISVLQDLGSGWYYLGGCFSADYQKYYVLPDDLRKSIFVVLDKKNNWSRRMVFDEAGVITKTMYWSTAITVDNEGYIYICGEAAGKTFLLKVAPDTYEITKIKDINTTGITKMAFNNKDKCIYATQKSSYRIIKFSTLDAADWELVTGGILPPKEIDGALDVAAFGGVWGIGFDADNYLYVCTYGGQTVRKIDLEKGEVSTFAGKGETWGYIDGTAMNARFQYPIDIAVTPDGIIYVLEYHEPDKYNDIDSRRLRCVAVQ